MRPKFSCERCETLVQAPAPARAIARGLAGPGLLAHVLVSKYADHWLFTGSDDGGERAAAIYTLLGTAQLNSLNIEAYLSYVLERLPEHPVNRIEEFLPWALADQLPSLRLAA